MIPNISQSNCKKDKGDKNDVLMNTRERDTSRLEINHYYVCMYSVPQGVCDDDLLTDGSSIVVSWRYVRRTDDKILCDDVYLSCATELSGTWPSQKIATAYYNNSLSEDYRGKTFNLTQSYMHYIQRLPNKRESDEKCYNRS
jgi:hypothetical protein